eukprot:TRINITY_DN1973_c0_g1_i2.p1 TRINITY_DN1973_c0_g1~~TRINITY_DN1973_c0_g1_i2.p1  ORF type:complete len:411 (+),score=75.86 TRINITY_DN1973_c0_g1_i2:29-1261(+)
MGAQLSLENDQRIKNDWSTLDIDSFMKQFYDADLTQRNDALHRLNDFVRQKETHDKLVIHGIIPALVSIVKQIPEFDIEANPDQSVCARLTCYCLAVLSDSEKYTPEIVEHGAVQPLVKICTLYPKLPIRLHCSRCLYHISESAFLRDEIKEAVKPSLDVIFSLMKDAGKDEKQYWDEILMNTDLVTHQYKPGKAWYDPADFADICKLLEDNYEVIKEEAITHCKEDAMVPWPEKNLYKDGWNVLGMYAFKNKLNGPCQMCPKTTAILEKIPGLQTAIFSTLKPRCHIKPHIGYYQYSEKILRLHMGLVVPQNCVIKVNGEERTWYEGKCLIFDDTFRHEVWNPSYDTTRIILMLDIDYEAKIEDRNPEFFEKSEKQAEDYGLSSDLINVLRTYGTPNNSNFQQRPDKYL